jgi:hypothetical protein
MNAENGGEHRNFSGGGMDKLRSMTGRKHLDEALNSHGQPPMESVASEDCKEASDRAGINCQRGQLQGVSLELENGDCEGVFYGAIQGRVRFNPSKGITFIFEDADGLWLVTIQGNNLYGMYRDLYLGRRESITTKGDCVRSIVIEVYTPPEPPGRG